MRETLTPSVGKSRKAIPAFAVKRRLKNTGQNDVRTPGTIALSLSPFLFFI
jgi:hypothetical protein